MKSCRPTSGEAYARFLQLFRDLELGRGSVCRICDAADKRPLLPWHVGDRYFSDGVRVVVAGKSHRDDLPTIVLPDGIRDGRLTARELQSDSTWPYWSYVREILGRVYGDAKDGWERIARTNLVKCTSVRGGMPSNDLTTPEMRNRCVRTLGVIREELSILAPDVLVLLTGIDYDEEIPYLACPPGADVKWIDRQDQRVRCGRKLLAFAEFTLRIGNRYTRALRTGHPERMKKNEFVALVGEWLAAAVRPR